MQQPSCSVKPLAYSTLGAPVMSGMLLSSLTKNAKHNRNLWSSLCLTTGVKKQHVRTQHGTQFTLATTRRLMPPQSVITVAAGTPPCSCCCEPTISFNSSAPSPPSPWQPAMKGSAGRQGREASVRQLIQRICPAWQLLQATARQRRPSRVLISQSRQHHAATRAALRSPVWCRPVGCPWRPCLQHLASLLGGGGSCGAAGRILGTLHNALVLHTKAASSTGAARLAQQLPQKVCCPP